jgi:hypothetical protein
MSGNINVLITRYQVRYEVMRQRTEKDRLENTIRFRMQYEDNPLAIFTGQHRYGDFVLIDCTRAAVTITGAVNPVTRESGHRNSM